MIDKKSLLNRNILFVALICVAAAILLFVVMLSKTPEPEFPELTVSFFDKEINLTNLVEDFRVNVTLSFPDKETWDLGEVPWFVETVTIEKSVPVKQVEGVVISGDRITYTLTFDNTLVRNLLWSRVYHMGASLTPSQTVSITIYGDWQGSEISGSEELTVFLNTE